jgi:endonuclease G
MSAPARRDAIDQQLLRQAEETARRWDGRRTVREARQKAINEEDFLSADSPARLAMRVNRLIQDVRRASRYRRPIADVRLRALAERDTPVQADELDNELIREAVVGARDFLSVEFLERGLAAARSVGRILVKTGGGHVARGTGFLVAPGLLLTNEHVLTSSTLAAACVVEMDYEQNWFGGEKRSQIFVLEPPRFFLNDRTLDFALVAVAPKSDRGVAIESYGWLPLISSQGKIAITGKDYINIIQHPLGREKEVVLRDNRILDLRTGDEQSGGDLGPFLHYEADTEKGSSGSPVLNDQWEVIALHHSGVPAEDENGNWLDKEGKVFDRATRSLDDLQWIANEGVRVSSLVNFIERAAVQPHERDFLNSFLSASPPVVLGAATEAQENAIVRAASSSSPSPASPPPPPLPTPQTAPEPNPDEAAEDLNPAPAPALIASGSDGSAVTIEVPLQISVSLGGGVAGASLTARIVDGIAGGAPEDLAEALPQDLADRRGFDRQFLGEKVPMPTIKAEPRFGGLLRLPRPAREVDEFELRYHHFSVLMCAGRRLAYLSACNVDYAAEATVGRSEGAARWKLDPRLDASQQLGSGYYAKNDYDKGHLTRREDVAWGRDKEQAKAANQDSFTYTNSAPQHFRYNQSSAGKGLRLWGELENFITSQGEEQRTRLSIFNGPVFSTADKPLKDALVPLAFFKIVIWRDGTEQPGAVGFLLEQKDLVVDLAERIDVGDFEVRQRRIADIEAMLDIEFGEKVRNWDRLLVHEAREATDAGEGVPIGAMADIRL